MHAQAYADDEPNDDEEVPVVLTKEELLQASLLQSTTTNFMLRKQILIHRSQDLQRESEALNVELRKAQDAIATFKGGLTEKYGVDFSKEQIDTETGRITTVSQAAKT